MWFCRVDHRRQIDHLSVKFNSSGTLLWKRSIRGETVQDNDLRNHYDDGIRLTDLCIDTEDNIYVLSETTFYFDDY